MVVLGDSVTWGQGLLPAQKFASAAYAALFPGAPAAEDLVMLAHSGAIIGVDATIDKPALDGEVPDSYPTIVRQASAYEGPTDDVDVVIVNGGINDVDPITILNPLTDRDDLREAITRHCYRDMKTLLTALSARFPNLATRIVVPSYFPILSDQSDMLRVPAFLGLHGLQLSDALAGLGDVVFGKIFDQCQLFFEASSMMLAQAVAETNEARGGTRIRYAQVPFTAANAALAPEAWLWGINLDLSPEDPVRDTRRIACERDEMDPVLREICYRASAGHPNVMGALQFASAVVAALAPPAPG
jgi:hypothetical protein